MNKHQTQEKKELLTWDTDYNGSAIYSLVDENGKDTLGKPNTCNTVYGVTAAH